jgi:hypothetical protein
MGALVSVSLWILHRRRRYRYHAVEIEQAEPGLIARRNMSSRIVPDVNSPLDGVAPKFGDPTAWFPPAGPFGGPGL